MSDLLEVLKRFNDDATRAILIAQEETRRSGHGRVGVVQLLLGLSLVERSPSARLLESKGLRGNSIRRKILDMRGLGDGHVPVEIPFSDAARELIVNSSAEAAHYGSESIGSEHLLMAYTAAEDSEADKLMEEFSVSKQALREEVEKFLKQNS